MENFEKWKIRERKEEDGIENQRNNQTENVRLYIYIYCLCELTGKKKGKNSWNF